jgi:hypothetical protein
MRRRSRALALASTAACVFALAACSGSQGATSSAWATSGPAASAAASGSTTSVPRPASTAQISIVSPTPNQVVTGTTIPVVVALSGATIVPVTTTNIRPDQGHIHLYVDGNLVSMNYGTTQDLPAVPGTHTLHAEFVAADHVPFNPRLVTPDVIFTVKP